MQEGSFWSMRSKGAHTVKGKAPSCMRMRLLAAHRPIDQKKPSSSLLKSSWYF